MWNHSRCKVTGQTILLDGNRINDSAVRQLGSTIHGFLHRSIAIAPRGVEFHLNIAWVQFSQVHRHFEAQVAAVGFHFERPKRDRVPLGDQLLLPCKQFIAEFAATGRSSAISHGCRNVVTVRVLADRAIGGIFRREAGHTLADAR